MRHGKKNNHLGRETSHRKHMLANMTSSLILNKRIVTTLAKAKALRSYAEPLITKAKVDTTHARRTVFSQLQNKDSVSILFGEISSRISERPGGYTRIIKLEEVRPGDGSKMCMIELVDFNDIYKKPGIEKKHKTRKRRKKTPPPSTTVDGINTEEEKPSVEKDNQPKKSE